jgi:ABC-type multidrug transport system permease subunit
MAVMSFGLAINQHAVFINGLPLLKYTDAMLMLATCFAVAVASLFLAQKATLFALITGAVTGASLFASSLIGWTLDPISTGTVGLSLLVVSVLGFVAWGNPFTSNA